MNLYDHFGNDKKEDDFYNYLTEDEKKAYSKEELTSYFNASKRNSIISYIAIYTSLYMILFCSLLILLKITLIPAKLNVLKYIFPSVDYYIQVGQNHIASTHSIFFLMIIIVIFYILRRYPFRFKTFFTNFFSSFFILKALLMVIAIACTIFMIAFYVPMENTCYQSEYYNRGCLGRDTTKDSVYFNFFFFFYTCLSCFLLIVIILAQYFPKELHGSFYFYASKNRQAILDEYIYGGIEPKHLYQRIKKWLADRKEGVDRWENGD